MSFNIIQTTVLKDKCIGCGVCDAICPVNILKMDFNKIGHYEPQESLGCLDKCTLCVDSCPFVKENKSEVELAKNLYGKEENINFHKDLGYFVKTYETHKIDLNERLKSASGGGANAFLTHLLESKQVDKILTVKSQNNPEKLFQFSIFDNIEDLKQARSSAYYPTELSEVLKYVKQNEGNYAITALPCFAKAIRLAQNKNILLRKRIKFVIGLVCGQVKTKNFTKELGQIAFKDDRIIKEVNFRFKQIKEPASNFAFAFKDENGNQELLSRKATPDKFWSTRAFTPNACNNCTDVFAHCADIVFMDAWLEKYIHDFKGHNLVIARTNEVAKNFENISELEVNAISSQDVLKSQQAVVNNKNSIALGSKNIFINYINKNKFLIQKLSNKDYQKNKIKILKLIEKNRKIEFLKALCSPKRVFNKVLKILKGNR